jgi:hypothetical protein
MNRTVSRPYEMLQSVDSPAAKYGVSKKTLERLLGINSQGVSGTSGCDTFGTGLSLRLFRVRSSNPDLTLVKKVFDVAISPKMV